MSRQRIRQDFRRSKWALSAVVMFGSAWLAVAAGAETMVVAGVGGGTSGRGVVLRLDTETGLRTLLSDLGDPGQGALGINLRHLTSEPDGDVLGADPFAGLLFHVDRNSGQRTVITNFADAGQGELGGFPAGIVWEDDHHVLVSDATAAVVFRIDLATGQRTVLSDFADAGQGPGDSPSSITRDAMGRLLVSDIGAGTGGAGAILVVHPTTGARTVLSDFGSAGQGDVVSLSSVAADAVAGIFAVSGQDNAIYRIDASTGDRTQVADFFDTDHGEIYDYRPSSLAVDSMGHLQVIGNPVVLGTSGLVITVDPATGDRALLSELGWGGQGATSGAAVGISRLGGLLFADGFESGDLGAWSAASPAARLEALP